MIGERKEKISMKELNREQYENFLKISERHLELIKTENKDKIDVATILINYAITDINRIIESSSSDSRSIDEFYHLMVKIDFLLGALESLYLLFCIYDKDGIRKKIYGNDNETVRKFRMYRSLTLAHPLETTYFEDLGFGKDNIRWCEDVRIKNRAFDLFNDELVDADYIIKVAEKGREFPESIPVSIEKDLLKVCMIVLDKLGELTNILKKQLLKKIDELKKEDIGLDKAVSDVEYISILKRALENRFPSEIEVIHYKFGKKKTSVLDTVERFLALEFSDTKKEEKYIIFKNELRSALKICGESVQNMDLDDESKYKVEQLIYPSIVNVEVLKDVDEIAQKHGKICGYLRGSSAVSSDSLAKKIRDGVSYSDLAAINGCTDGEWGILQLSMIANKLEDNFKIDLINQSDDIIYIQYCVALYFAKKENKKLETM